MLLERHYDDRLAQASYIIGCQATGEALVVDPGRDVARYIDAAERAGLKVAHVTETHIHADYVSGSRELAHRTGAKLYLSDEGDANWKYAFAKDAGAELLHDGDSFMVGNVKIQAIHTPGHTPEHLCFLVTDTRAATEPMAILTGDFVFAGDVGRPDLLERAANYAGTMESAARTLYASLQKFRELPEWLQLWPGHGAGSACGKALGAVPASTVGYEVRFNWAFGARTEDEFVEQVLAGQPEPPKYFAEMKRINKEGPPILGGLPQPRRLSGPDASRALSGETLFVDTRKATSFAAGHVPGTINIPLNNSFSTWAGWLIPYDRDFILIAPDGSSANAAAESLSMIGLDRLTGWIDDEIFSEWTKAGGELQSTPQATMGDVAAIPDEERGDRVTILDVRGESEWSAGHIPGAEHIPLGYLPDRASELERHRRIIVHCQGGGRASIGASILQSLGFRNVVAVGEGGFGEWERAGYEIERGNPAAIDARSPEPSKQSARAP
jgi:hydroxyacylglutathione hydrolase